MLLYGAKLWSEKPIGKRRRQLWMERVERMRASTWVTDGSRATTQTGTLARGGRRDSYLTKQEER